MRIAAVQTDVSFADRTANLARIETILTSLSRENLQLIVFPECMLCGYGYNDRDEALQQAVTIDDDCFTRLAHWCGDSNLHLTLGFLLRSDDRLYNASAMIGPGGVVGQYRKVHLPHLGVDRYVDRGNLQYRTYPAGDANVGMAICYDCSFPEPMRVLGLAGADIIALGTNWPVAAARTAEVVPAARSMENHYYFVAANRIGHERGFDFCGKSSITGPDGIILAATDTADETVLIAEIDPATARNKRIERTTGAHVIDRLADRQPEFYNPIVEPVAK